MATAHGNPFFMICDKTSVSQLVDPTRTFITIRDNDTVTDALNTLTQHKISSCPVLDSKTDKCLGGIDFLFLLKFLATEARADNDTLGINQDNGKRTIGEVLDHTGPRLQPFFVEGSIAHCIDLMTKVHRVALYKKNFELATTLSQTDVLRYLQTVIQDAKAGQSYTRRYARDINQLCETKLADLGVFHTPRSLKSTATIYEAIDLCTQQNFRVVSILNDEGQIIGDFNVGKLSALRGYYHQLTTLTLHNWITKIHPIKPEDVPCISADATYEQAIMLMLSLRRHHLWSINQNKEPILVVTITDLFKVLQPKDINKNELSGVASLSQLWKS